MAEVFVYFAVKLQSIISYDRLRYSELADDILPHKLGDVLDMGACCWQWSHFLT